MSVKVGPFKTISISGFGGGYEDQCQRMLWRGVAWLAERKPPLSIWESAKSNPQIVGVLLTKGDDLKSLEAAMIKPGDDVTGAMHQFTMNHIAYIHQHGTDGWIEAAKARGREIVEWEGEL